jgi:hypothetical protein
MSRIAGASLALLLSFACPPALNAAEAWVRSIDAAKGTVTLESGHKAVSYPLARLIVLPRPEGASPGIVPDERVEVATDGKWFVIRRPAKLEEQRNAMLGELPAAKREAIERAIKHREEYQSPTDKKLWPPSLKVGQVGRLQHQLRVLQVIDDENMLVSFTWEDESFTFWIQGTSTKNLADDQRTKLPGVFKVEKTKRYESKAGQRTVMLLVPEKEKSPIASVKDLQEADRFELAVTARRNAEKLAQMDAKTKAASAEPAAKPADTSERDEVAARLKLKLAKELRDEGKPADAYRALQRLIKDFPKTKAAEEARRLLK